MSRPPAESSGRERRAVRRGRRRCAPGRCGVLFADGDLRQVRRGDTEVARRIYVAIRDLDWNTLPGEISDLRRSPTTAAASRSASPAGTGRAAWTTSGTPRSTATADGTIRYRMHGAALSAFPYAKIGICVHHPTDGFAGQPYRGHARPRAGQRHAAGRHRPADSPRRRHRPAARSSRSATWTVTHASGGVVRFEFAGDLWEMEDQRNWTDASYKSASTPAQPRLPPRGRTPATQFDQQVVIRAARLPARRRRPARPAWPADHQRRRRRTGRSSRPSACAAPIPRAAWSDRARAVAARHRPRAPARRRAPGVRVGAGGLDRGRRPGRRSWAAASSSPSSCRRATTRRPSPGWPGCARA